MPLYTKSSFAKHCGKTSAHVSVALTRKQLVASGDYIDSGIEKNKLTMNKWRAASGLIDATSTQLKISEPSEERPAVPNVSEPAPLKSSFTELENDKKRADIAWKQEKTTETALKNAKLRGELIPTAMVINLFAMLGHAFQTQYEIGTSNLIMDLSHKAKLSPEIEGEIRSNLIVLINKAHKSAIEDAKKGVRKIVSSVYIEETKVDDDVDDPDD